MKMEITVTGAAEVRQKILALAAAAPQRVADALGVEAELTMTEAKKLTPVVTGALRASGFVQTPTISDRTIEVVMGFGGSASAYALSVHENPRAGQTQGFAPSGQRYKRWSRVGQWKFLEQPFLARVSGLTDRLLERILRNA